MRIEESIQGNTTSARILNWIDTSRVLPDTSAAPVSTSHNNTCLTTVNGRDPTRTTGEGN